MTNENSQLTKSDRIAERIRPDVASETAIVKGGMMAFRNIEQIMEFGKIMSIASVAIPKHLRDNPGACLAVAIQASEWEMSPFSVANKTYVVNDRLAYEAQLVNAVILKRAPIIGRFSVSYQGEGDNRQCTVSARLKDGDQVEYTSPKFGKIPVKNSPLWKSDPDQQLFYYSSRAMCRRHFPDVILGIYTPDEMDELKMVEATEIPKARLEFGPATPETPNEPDPNPKTKRHRRTKAEMEAAREPEPTPEPPPTVESETKPELPDEPESALAKLRRLLSESNIEEPKFLRFLITERYVEPSDTLDKLDDSKLSEIIVSLPSIQEDMEKSE